jgi:menaquinone-specific isochorismate synthase
MQNPVPDLRLPCEISQLRANDPWQIADSLSEMMPLYFIWRGRSESALWMSFGCAHRASSLQNGRDILKSLEFTGTESTIRPRAFAITAFNPNSILEDSLWHGFQSRVCMIPQIQVCIRDHDAVLFRLGADPQRAPIQTLHERDANPLQIPLITQRVLHTSETAWHEQIGRIQREIHAGGLDKAVLARAVSLWSNSNWPHSEILRRLTAKVSDEFVFAHKMGDGIFLGKSPERLFRLSGQSIETESLAGTQATDLNNSSQLLESEKDRREQSYVSRFIQTVLSPLCSAPLNVAPLAVRNLSYARHLQTRFHGMLNDHVTPDDVLGALHPTPAVCGEPQPTARDLLQSLEPLPRGLYAGAVGWVDAQDAEFAVAIRSAVIRGKEACLFAGAGIVAESDPDAEWNETALKMSPMLSALGC